MLARQLVERELTPIPWKPLGIPKAERRAEKQVDF
jgi:hypothetical protein